MNVVVSAYLCIIPWLLTHLARGWRLVYIYNQQVDFEKTTLQRNGANNLNKVRMYESGRDASAIAASGITGSDQDALATGVAAVPGAIPMTVLDHGYGASADNPSPEQIMNNDVQREQRVTQHDIPLTITKTNVHNDTDININTNTDINANVPNMDTDNNAPNVTTEKNLDASLTSSNLKLKPKLSIPLAPNPLFSNNNSIVKSIITPTSTTSTASKIFPFDTQNDGGSLARTISPTLGTALFPISNDTVLESDGAIVQDKNDIADQQRALCLLSMAFDDKPERVKYRWSRYLPFNQATDGRLAVFLLVCMVIPLAICIGMQFVRPSPVQINPINYKCGEGPV
ncbi:hypothetical protein BX616_004261, partial [Lobosporangium transversale]